MKNKQIDAEVLLSSLRQRGFRITRLRKLVIGVLAQNHLPLSYNDILRHIGRFGMHPNKTSIYRELDFLISQRIVHALEFNESRKRYELSLDEHHHHHVVCQSCKSIGEVHDVKALEVHLRKFEKYLTQKFGFRDIAHRLDFFGTCSKCLQQE